jgi:dTDP-4-amino-4,6-dideoxygalactose transaminase
MAWRIFDDEDLMAVKEVLDSGNLCAIGGAQTPAFEQEFAAEFGAPHALAVTNAMAGLHCAVAAAGVQPGDEVIVDPIVSFAMRPWGRCITTASPSTQTCAATRI